MSENISARVYFEVRSGLKWEVWYSYQNGYADPANGATKWKATSVRYWRRINAMRTANAMWTTFNDGVWCGSAPAEEFR